MSKEPFDLGSYPFTIRSLSREDGGGYLIEYPDIPGCMSDGETPSAAILNGHDALNSALRTLREFGDPIPNRRERTK
jgi:antitoxin HicB